MTDDEKLKKNLSNKPKNGGVRPGAGRPKGSVSDARKEELEALARFKDRVRKRIDRLINAQASLAEGVQYLYKAQVTIVGVEHTLITDQEEIKTALDAGLHKIENGEYYYITTKAPDNKAIDSMLDRTFGKAKETVDLKTNNPLTKVVVEIVDNNHGRTNIDDESDKRISEDGRSTQDEENNP